MPFREVKVPAGYRCPLCSDHRDTEFVRSKVVGQPICEGCFLELSSFLEEEERTDDFVLDRLESFTGRSFLQNKKNHFEETLEELKWRIRPENVAEQVVIQQKTTGQSFDEVVSGWQEMIKEYERFLADLS